jgi:hypothetical protein
LIEFPAWLDRNVLKTAAWRGGSEEASDEPEGAALTGSVNFVV